MNKTAILFFLLSGLFLALPLFAAIHTVKDSNNSSLPAALPTHAVDDFHSYANPRDVRVRHVDLDLEVLFDQKILKGITVLSVERVSQNKQAPLILDTRNLNIAKVETSADGASYTATTYTLGSSDKFLGAPLTIHLPEAATRVRINYFTDPAASGVQWLDPAQTAGKKDPFVFTQSQAIHARSWIPLQDTPQVRVTC